MAKSVPFPSVLDPVQQFLDAPDAPEVRGPMGPAAALATAMAGATLFGASCLWATGGGGAEGQDHALSALPAFLVGVPLAQVLCFPPLYLWTTLKGHRVPPLRLAAAVTAGPAALGAWLGSVAPVFLLYGLSGPVGAGRSAELPSIAVGLLGLACTLAALFVGARNAVRAGRHLQLEAPGAFAQLGHYAAVLWTTLILVVRLSA